MTERSSAFARLPSLVLALAIVAGMLWSLFVAAWWDLLMLGEQCLEAGVCETTATEKAVAVLQTTLFLPGFALALFVVVQLVRFFLAGHAHARTSQRLLHAVFFYMAWGAILATAFARGG